MQTGYNNALKSNVQLASSPASGHTLRNLNHKFFSKAVNVQKNKVFGLYFCNVPPYCMTQTDKDTLPCTNEGLV
jgi:hypothetical protein